MRILMVEDHEKFAKAVIAEFFHEHDVTVAAGVEMAKARFEHDDYDVALVDYDLPDGKGEEVVRWMRANDLAIPVIAISSHEFGNNRIMVAGADAICSKMKFRQLPEHLEEVAGAVDSNTSE